MTPAKERVATITGTFLAPGVSLNGRLYTKEAIGKAVARMQSAIEDGTAPPITQLTSHGTDDVLQTVGSLSKVWQAEDGSAKFESAVPDTTAGRDLATLTKHGYVRNVSISGRWLGKVENRELDGQEVETAEDLEVVRVDFVPKPGVSAARIDTVAMAEGSPTGDWRDDVVTEAALVDEDGNFADPGFQGDKQKRYPLDSEEHVRAAWSYINMPKNARKYDPSDLAKVKARIKTAAKKYGIEIADKESADPALGEGAFDTALLIRNAALLIPVDPDGDGDVDALVCPTCGSFRPVTDPELNPDAGDDEKDNDNGMSPESAKEPTMSEEVHPTPAAGISEADAAKIGAAIAGPLAAALKEALAPAPAPVAQEVAPAPAPAESTEEMVKRLLAEQKAELTAAFVKEHGLPQRTGVVVTEETKPSRPLHEMSMNDREFKSIAREAAQRLVHPGVTGV